MGGLKVLNHIFSSPESISRMVGKDDRQIIADWNSYLKTIDEKTDIILKFMEDQHRVQISAIALSQEKRKKMLPAAEAAANQCLAVYKARLDRLKELLELEIVEIGDEQAAEADLIAELDEIKHKFRIDRIERLRSCVNESETEFDHGYRLLKELFSILKAEIHMCNLLLKNFQGVKQVPDLHLIQNFGQEFQLEMVVMKHIALIEEVDEKKFVGILLALAKGEATIHRMEAMKNKFVAEVEDEVSGIYAGKIQEGPLFECLSMIYANVEKLFTTKLAESIPNTPYSPYETVNSASFVTYASAILRRGLGRDTDPKKIDAIIHVFRQLYNENEYFGS
jgi:hypothetical protein